MIVTTGDSANNPQPGTVNPATLPGPMAGIRVLEVAGWMAAPSAAAIMADMGADVIKIEPVGGDYMRGAMRPPRVAEDHPAAGFDAAFTADNRGKRSVAVNMKDPQGADLIRRLAERSDVFVCNLLPERQRRFGIDPSSLVAVNPKLVHATLIGYGSEGVEADRPGYDVTAFWGRSGLAALAAEPETGQPRVMPNALGDHMTGLALLAAVLAALRVVEQTGEHQVVETSLLGTALWGASTDLSTTLVDGYQPSRRPRSRQLSPLGSAYPCAEDKWIVVTMPGTYPTAWQDLCTAFDLAGLAADPRFESGKARFQNMAELLDIMDHQTRSRTVGEWGKRLDAVGIPWSAVQSTVDVADDPQVVANDFVVDVPTASGDLSVENMRTVASPIKMKGVHIAPQGPAPAVGADTEAVLTEVLELTAADLADLEAAGAISRPEA